MGKAYVPIYLDWLYTTQDLTPEEKGNLVDAMVSYASGLEYEHLLTGGCRIAFLPARLRPGKRYAAAGKPRPNRSLPKQCPVKAKTNKQKQTKTKRNKAKQNAQ